MRIGVFGLSMMLALITFSACKSSKEVVKPASTNDVRKLETYLHQGMPFKSFEAKVQFQISAKEGIRVSMNGNIKMRKDSCLILNAQMFGIEAAKCLITNDSILIINRLNREYAVEYIKNSAFKEYINIAVLQDIFANRMFVPGKINPDERVISRFDLLKHKDASGYRWGEDRYILDFLLNKDKQYVQLKANRPETSESVLLYYDQFKAESFGFFPRQLRISTVGLKTNANLQINFDKPKFDAATDFKFELPAKYKRVSVTDLIKRIQNMI